jgi:mono/diheme cytochrome c family protein
MNKGLPVSLLIILLLAACGGGSSADTPQATPVPSVTPVPLYQYISPTPVSTVFAALATTTPAASAAEATAEAIDPKVVEAGLGRYVALTCGECHGDAGQGAGEKGPALVPVTMTQADFITLLRSGGKLGSKHQYATNRLSDRGAQNLYLYLVSLGS